MVGVVLWTKPLTAPPAEASDTKPADGCARAGDQMEAIRVVAVGR